MAKKARAIGKNTKKIPRGVSSPRGYFSKANTIMKNGGKKNSCK